VLFHIRRGLCPHTVRVCDLDGSYGLLGVKKDELTGRLFVRRGIVELDVKQIVPYRLDMGMVLGIEGFGVLHLTG